MTTPSSSLPVTHGREAHLSVTHGREAHPAEPHGHAFSRAYPAGEPPIARWYALRVRSRAEFAVERALAEYGAAEPYVPTWTEETRWSDRMARTVRPLFAGYVF